MFFQVFPGFSRFPPAGKTGGGREQTLRFFQCPRAWAEARMQSNSACAVGSLSRSLRFLATATTCPDDVTMTAPTGTSPSADASLAWSRATLMNRSSSGVALPVHRRLSARPGSLSCDGFEAVGCSLASSTGALLSPPVSASPALLPPLAALHPPPSPPLLNTSGAPIRSPL